MMIGSFYWDEVNVLISIICKCYVNVLCYSLIPGEVYSHTSSLSWADILLHNLHSLWNITPLASIIGANRVNNHDAILVHMPGTHLATEWKGDTYLQMGHASSLVFFRRTTSLA